MNATLEMYDGYLDKIHQYGPATTEGFFNHTPMAMEAVCQLGFEDHLPAWIASKWQNAVERGTTIATITDANWQASLGNRDSFEDWLAYFQQDFSQRGWQTSLNHWCGILAKGFIASAAHGVIRTAHAYRALCLHQSSARLNELAHALASWASAYTELPTSSNSQALGQLSPREALNHIIPVGPRFQSGEGMITAGYQSLVNAPGFAEQVMSINIEKDLNATALKMMVAFAEFFIMASHSRFTTIVFTHAVTGIAAARNLLPGLDKKIGRELLFRAWEASCALKSAFQDKPLSRINSKAVQVSESLAKNAVIHGGDHTIKLTEACLNAYTAQEDDIFLKAADFIQRQL